MYSHNTRCLRGMYALISYTSWWKGWNATRNCSSLVFQLYLREKERPNFIQKEGGLNWCTPRNAAPLKKMWCILVFFSNDHLNIWLSVPWMKQGLAPSMEPGVAQSSTGVQRCSCRAQWARKPSTGPRLAAAPPTDFQKSSFKNGIERKKCKKKKKIVKNKPQCHWDMILEVSWCLQNSRMEKKYWDFPIKCWIPALLFWVSLH